MKNNLKIIFGNFDRWPFHKQTIVLFQISNRRFQYGRFIHFPICWRHHWTKFIDQQIELITSLFLTEISWFPSLKRKKKCFFCETFSCKNYTAVPRPTHTALCTMYIPCTQQSLSLIDFVVSTLIQFQGPEKLIWRLPCIGMYWSTTWSTSMY